MFGESVDQIVVGCIRTARSEIKGRKASDARYVCWHAINDYLSRTRPLTVAM